MFPLTRATHFGNPVFWIATAIGLGHQCGVSPGSEPEVVPGEPIEGS